MIEKHSTRDSGVNSYIDLENRPDDIIDTIPPHALLVLIVVRVLPPSVIFTNALLSLSLLGVNSPPVVVAGITVVSIMSSGLFSKSAPSTTFTAIDFAIYIDISALQIYENGTFKGTFTSSLIDGATYNLPPSVIFTNALLSLSLLGVNSPPVVVAGITVVSIMSSGLFSKSI
jgi:hypothetical protein